jgi:hypothetical protein
VSLFAAKIIAYAPSPPLHPWVTLYLLVVGYLKMKRKLCAKVGKVTIKSNTNEEFKDVFCKK